MRFEYCSSPLYRAVLSPGSRGDTLGHWRQLCPSMLYHTFAKGTLYFQCNIGNIYWILEVFGAPGLNSKLCASGSEPELSPPKNITTEAGEVNCSFADIRQGIKNVFHSKEKTWVTCYKLNRSARGRAGGLFHPLNWSSWTIKTFLRIPFIIRLLAP